MNYDTLMLLSFDTFPPQVAKPRIFFVLQGGRGKEARSGGVT